MVNASTSPERAGRLPLRPPHPALTTCSRASDRLLLLDVLPVSGYYWTHMSTYCIDLVDLCRPLLLTRSFIPTCRIRHWPPPRLCPPNPAASIDSALQIEADMAALFQIMDNGCLLPSSRMLVRCCFLHVLLSSLLSCCVVLRSISCCLSTWPAAC
ncbi:uncharacterized protein LOC123401368 [Hordeum vulgare subsp. vulgare]|uniref:uncharacterized protein LOC123401368 n=1 Tax=Hordeum vulgare subsp. vulgare TaxID=112509 RepID=UPI001D1A4494|nr:uncharacterized protein LOC123401368 [Hordeum vulgare subsp. vulgare]